MVILRRSLLVGAALALLASGCDGSDSSTTTTTSTGGSDGSTTTVADAAGSGYELIAPMSSTTSYLIDGDGTVVYSWDSDSDPALATYLVDGPALLRTGSVSNDVFDGAAGAGGSLSLLDADSKVVWSHEFSSDTYLSHHDVEELPSGNVLLILWEVVPAAEAQAAGIDTSSDIWADMVWEFDPDTGDTVWEWHVKDHLTQDGSDLGRLDVDNAPLSRDSDWNHVNSVDYNDALDQIVLSSHNQGEIWVIDHDTTTEEAAGEAGDFLWRWGNPGIYGGSGDQVLQGQHNAEWIDSSDGSSNITIFNNGTDASSVLEIDPPAQDDGTYTKPGDDDSSEIVWSYEGDPPSDFYATNLSSAQRLDNGDTLITNGPSGYVFEVTADGETVWDYTVPGTGSVFKVNRYTSDDVAALALTDEGTIPEQSAPGGGSGGPGGEPGGGAGPGGQ